MREKERFIDLYFSGECNLTNVGNYILNDEVEDIDECDKLGFTPEEYKLFKEGNTKDLEELLRIRKRAFIIEKAKQFFKDEIVRNHFNNAKKLVNLKNFQLNPFLDKYKANFLKGNSSPESIARILVYPRVLGTSLNTTFGNSMQKFCSRVLDGFASTTTGMDIEFVDAMDGRRKYCQIKAGPNTINKDDITTINNHFLSVRNLARTNNLDIRLTDMVVGVLYGTPDQLSSSYRKIDETYPVYVGQEFWHRLTGDQEFYQDLSDAMADAASEYDGSQLLEEIIQKLAEEIELLM